MLSDVVVKLIGGIVCAVAMFSDCELFGLWQRALLGRQSRLAVKVHSGCVVRTIGGTPGIAVMP